MNLISIDENKRRLAKEALFWGVQDLFNSVISNDRQLFSENFSTKLESLRTDPLAAKKSSVCPKDNIEEGSV
jgi:hypothetical protein